MAIKITIVGWYGTETIGDRAILAGLFSFFSNAFISFEINLGSLYPFFTKRTIDEDSQFWDKICNRKIKIKIFDSRKSNELDCAINKANLVVIGGGPLMHINPLFMIEYAMKKAKKLNKKTAVLGCGIGPIFSAKFRKSLIEIIDNADLIVLRDTFSQKYLDDIYKSEGKTKKKKILSAIDPAVQCTMDYNRICSVSPSSGRIVLNLRDFPQEYSKSIGLKKQINNKLYDFVDAISSNFSNHEILLLPMHYFHVGSDDREFLNRICFTLQKKNLTVQNKPISLVDTMKEYSTAEVNIGMRFHAVVLQTILKGNNIILDYTEPKKGKISGFINDIDRTGHYLDKYICLQEDDISTKVFSNIFSTSFSITQESLSSKLEVYTEGLKSIL